MRFTPFSFWRSESSPAASPKTITDFTVGGRNAGAWMSAFSYGTAYFSAVMFIGYAGKSGWDYGLWAVLPGIGNALIGSLLAWLVLARRTRETTRRLKIKSMPQFFEKRFGGRGIKRFCVAVIFVFLLPYSASVYKGLTSVCAVLLKVDERVCMVVIALAAAAIVVLGGYAATLRADFVQGIVMLGVIALIAAVIRCDQVGGLSAGLEAITKATEGLHLTAAQHIGLWATVLMTSFGTWGLPQMIHKYYGIRDDREVRRGTVISTVFALVVAGGGYFIGSFSRLFFTELPSPPAGGAGHPDYLIPNMLYQSGIPTVLIGVVLVLLIAASVSTLSSITITASSTPDHGSDPTPTPTAGQGKSGMGDERGSASPLVVLSYVIANSKTPSLDMMSHSWGIISGLLPRALCAQPVLEGINRAGAWAGIIGGFATALPPPAGPALLPFGQPAFFGPLKGPRSPFRVPGDACLPLLLCWVVSGIGSRMGLKSAAPNPAFYEKEAGEPAAVLR